ncbi:MAG: K(+)-transporting ATPase subunit C [Kamptonema sp. SIO1D9]|nr:K(+)-transporting ATPase subunit C [Kamptonema sp. SIO1D9]
MKEIMMAIRSTFVLWLLTAILYPAVILLIAQTAFPYQANGSLITNTQGEIIGSELIGQTFTSQEYFWSRPSTVNYSEGDDAYPGGLSGASNLAPTNEELITRVKKQADFLRNADVEPTADLVYASGSGLDPHITIEAARAQIERVARARNLDDERVETLISQSVDRRFLGIFGEPGVNVLKLNLALDGLI